MWADVLKGAGAVLGAGATFYGAKKQSKIQKEMLEDKKRRDILADRKLEKVEDNLNSAISNVYDEKKKKKQTMGTSSGDIDLGQAYGA